MSYTDEQARWKADAAAAASHALHRLRLAEQAATAVTAAVIDRPGVEREPTVEENRARAKAWLVQQGKVVIRSSGAPRPWAIRDPDGNVGTAWSASGVTVAQVERPGDGGAGDAAWKAIERAEDDDLFRQWIRREDWPKLGVADGPVVTLPPGLEGL